MIFLHLCFIAFALAHPVTEDTEESSRVRDVEQLFQQFWEWKLVNNPEFATRIGILKYDDQVNDLGLTAFKRRAAEVRLFLQRLRSVKKFIDVKKHVTLNLNMDLLERDLVQYLSGMKFNTYVWPMSVMEGPQNDPAYLINLMKKETGKDLCNIVTRIRLFSQQIYEDIYLLAEGLRIRQTMHRKSFEKVIGIFKKLSSGKAEKSPFFKPFKVRPKNIKSDKEWKSIVNSAKIAIVYYIQPAYYQLYHFTNNTYLPKSRPKIGLSSVPDGKNYYQALLKYHTTTDLKPIQVHRIGLMEVKRITKRMEEIRKDVKFNGTLDQFRRYLQTTKKFGFQNETHMLNHYEGIRSKILKLLPKYFGVLPKIPFVIKPIPKDLAPTAPMAYYNEPSPNGTGIFFLNTYGPQDKRQYIAESLFLHEAIPGHHLQIALKIEHGSPVLFRRYAGMDVPYYQAPASFAMNTAYTEGWGLYSEYLGEEMGMYKDPYVLFGRLSQEMMRACRLVVDTGMHYFGWSRDKAIKFMNENTADDLHNIKAETDRYISIPGQACGYKIGELKIKELRSLAEKELKEKFNLRKFHDYLLKLGNIPLTILEKQMKLFIKKEKQ